MSLPPLPFLLPAAAAAPAWPVLVLLGAIVGLRAVFGSSKPEDDVSGEEIRNLRKRKNLTQEELASVLGVGIATIRRWEAGTAKPTGNNHASLQQLMATPELPNLVQLQNESQGPWEDLLKMLLADGRVKRILASRMLSVDLAGSELPQSGLPQLLGLFQGGNPSDQIEPAMPFPKTSLERSRVRQEELKGVVDAVLVERFVQEQEARGLTSSKMLETILWKHFGYPALSFQPGGADGPPDDPSYFIERGTDEKEPE